MARYFFHLCDGGDILLDPEGRTIDDASQITSQALKEARSIIGHEAMQGMIRLDRYIEVQDDSGKVVCRLPFRESVVIVG